MTSTNLFKKLRVLNPKYSFSGRVFWATTPIFALAIVGIALVSLRRHDAQLGYEFTNRGDNLARHVAKESELAVFSESQELLEASTQSVSLNQDVAYVCIEDATGRTLFKAVGSVSKDLSSEQDDDPRIREFSARIHSTVGSRNEEELLGLKEDPVPSEDVEIIGNVRLGISTEHLTRQRRSIIRLWIILGLSTLVATSMAILAVARYLGAPIRELIRGARSIAAGNLEGRVRQTTCDEMGELASTFNEMATSLAEASAAKDRLVESLREAGAELAAASKAKSEFLANMSHEIRTPLNGVTGVNELLLRTQLDSRQRRYAEVIRTSAKALLTVLNDILDFSKIEAGKMELEEIDFDPRVLIDDIVARFTPMADHKGLEISREIAQEVPRSSRGDPQRIGQVVSNLLNNAIKFTNEGCVSVRVAAAPGAIRFEVEDTGIGIPSDRLTQIFESFSQVDASTTRRFGGTGLGLAICSRLVKLMGGEIAVESKLGEGAKFWFTIAAAEVADSRVRDKVLELSGVRALVVASACVEHKCLDRRLRRLGLQVDSVTSNDAALNALQFAMVSKRPYKFCAVDLDDSGAELLSRIREESRLSQTIVLATSSSESSRVGESLAPRSDAVLLVKPIRESELVETLLQAMSAPAIRSEAKSMEDATVGETARRFRILVAEDNEINQLVVTELLSHGGYEWDVVDDGSKAVEAVRTRRFDLVLMDWMMPVMEGGDATREIRRIESEQGGLARAGTEIPVVALTANALESDHELSFECGLNDHLNKPLDPEQLFATLTGLLTAQEVESATS